MSSPEVLAGTLTCYHCGEPCTGQPVEAGGKTFCCTGCSLVYGLLSENNLCTYYQLNRQPGISPQQVHDHKFDYLDLPEVRQQLIRFSHEGEAHVTFYLPAMHCSSCIWLLEHLHRLDPAITGSSVHFQRRELSIVFKEQGIRLSSIAQLLTHIGYEPLITLSDMQQRKAPYRDKGRIIHIAVAGFCFGNIMMMSFPEYFGLTGILGQAGLQVFFRYLNLALSLPVLLYSAAGFFTSAWKSIAQRHINIDAPIALAITVTFLRSLYEILSGTGAGYLDSMTGIVFFMLIGRYVQQRTYDTLSFDRDYTSYFPLAARVLVNGAETSRQVSQLRPGDVIVIRNRELVPADARLLSPRTHIDYSFVSGESAPVARYAGELVYAGGRQLDGAITLEVTRSVSHSYLTGLWNNEAADRGRQRREQTLTDHINRWFTVAVLLIAASACIYWLLTDPSRALNAMSAVLIVACPCGLLLTTSFTQGSMIRLMGRAGCYVKNAGAIESMADIDTIVLDKTGTVTHGSQVAFKGTLRADELAFAVSLAAQSAHVLSTRISAHYAQVQRLPVTAFAEVAGMGICGNVEGHTVMMGSDRYITGHLALAGYQASRVFLSIDGTVKGFFSISHAYRSGFDTAIRQLQQRYEVHMLSGDNAAERSYLQQLFAPGFLHFDQRPHDKLAYIRRLQEQGRKVMMVGDGLNDAHAFRQSDMSMAVSDDAGMFSPACKAILGGASFRRLPALLRFAGAGSTIIAACFSFSLVYNVAGLFFAVQDALSPVIAAILMPASTISIVLISTLSVYAAGRRLGR